MSNFFNTHRETIELAGRPLTLETGRIARQADGAVVVSYGDTVILCTVVAAKAAKENADFFPLSVHYLEKTFAVGRIPGGFFKREGKPSEREVLASRLIDRPIRPLFPEFFHNEVQILCTVLSYDTQADSEIASIIGASAALSISGVPFLGPVGAARVGYKDGQFILQPSPAQVAEGQLDLIVAGTREGVLMVESQAKELPEEIMLGAVTFGHTAFMPVLDAIDRLKANAGKAAWTVAGENPLIASAKEKISAVALADLTKAYELKSKQDRYSAIDAAYAMVFEKLAGEFAENQGVFDIAFEALKSDILRGNILNKATRVDGRSLTCIRPIVSEVGVLSKTHGSALFTRGETQALVVATLGTSQDEQLIDGLDGEYRERFMLHYNFPSYSVGEVGRVTGPGRREIGHGKLAWRALATMIPDRSKFPYTLRAVSEITESNGSSSMATVCGTSLALMDAGVPLERPVAGIAMGLIKEKDQFAVLSDILGDEDHLGDMDFKVAGTEKGVTALQMDIKITSITPEIMKIALGQAKEGRLHILGEMDKAISHSRSSVSENAPRLHTFNINRDKIRDVIGSGGKVIREICETTGAKIDILDDGTVTVAGHNQKALDTAVAMIMDIACDPEVGAVYTGTVVKVAEFGAFVNIMGSRDGLVHVSELANYRVAKVGDVVKTGDKVKVIVLGFDDRGKIKLSMKQVPQAAQA